jgi:phosphate/sulfate permease
LGLGILFRMGGERVQEVVEEKSHVVDVRAATLIDLVYAFILFYFKFASKMPMSTTWVFLGLLAGRELAMTLRRTTDRSLGHAARLMAKDILFASIGLLVSLLLAIAVNEPLRTAILG